MFEDLTLKDVRKALIALATLAANLIALGVMPEQIEEYAVAVFSALGALGVFAARNGEPIEDVLEIFMEQDDEPQENEEV